MENTTACEKTRKASLDMAEDRKTQKICNSPTEAETSQPFRGGKLWAMIDRTKRSRLNQIGFVFALAIAIAEGGLQWSRVPVPRLLGLLMLLIGFGLLAWCSWAVGHLRHPVLGAFALFIAVAFYGWMGWLSHQDYSAKDQTKVEPPNTTPNPMNKTLAPLSRGTLTTASRSNAPLQEFTLILHNDATDPQFYVNELPGHPARYSSGIATFRLPGGSYRFRVEYPNWTCSAIVSVPLEKPEPVPANCKLK